MFASVLRADAVDCEHLLEMPDRLGAVRLLPKMADPEPTPAENARPSFLVGHDRMAVSLPPPINCHVLQAALLPTSNLNGALVVLRVFGIITAVLAFVLGFFYYTLSVYTFVLVYLIRVWQRIGVSAPAVGRKRELMRPPCLAASVQQSLSDPALGRRCGSLPALLPANHKVAALHPPCYADHFASL